MQNNTQENLENVAVSSNDETFQKAPTVHDASIIKRIPSYLNYYCHINQIGRKRIVKKSNLPVETVKKLLIERSLDIPIEHYVKIVDAIGLKEYAQKIQASAISGLFVGEAQKDIALSVTQSLTIEEYICILINFNKIDLVKEILPFTDKEVKNILEKYLSYKTDTRQWKKTEFPPRESATSLCHSPTCRALSGFESFSRYAHVSYVTSELDLEVFAKNAQVSIDVVEKLFKNKSFDMSLQDYINILNALDYKEHTDKLRSHEIISFVLEQENDIKEENSSARICPIFTMEEYLCLLLFLDNQAYLDEFSLLSNEELKSLKEKEKQQRRLMYPRSMSVRAFYESQYDE